MKVNHDKHSKAGYLSFELEKYENSPKYKLNPDDQIEAVPSEQIKLPIVRHENRNESSKSKSHEKIKNKSIPKSKGINDNLSAEIQDEEQLFAMCNTLTSKIQSLKKQKYEFVVEQYEKQERKKMESVLNKQKLVIREKYNILRKQLNSSYDQEKSKIKRSLDDIKKIKKAYQAIIEDLTQKKTNVQVQYQQSITNIKEQKEKIINEWKRNSNEQLVKIGMKYQ